MSARWHHHDLGAGMAGADLGEAVGNTVETHHSIDLRYEPTRGQQLAEEREVVVVRRGGELVEGAVGAHEREPRPTM